jgi:hypothetical protein
MYRLVPPQLVVGVVPLGVLLCEAPLEAQQVQPGQQQQLGLCKLNMATQNSVLDLDSNKHRGVNAARARARRC